MCFGLITWVCIDLERERMSTISREVDVGRTNIRLRTVNNVNSWESLVDVITTKWGYPNVNLNSNEFWNRLRSLRNFNCGLRLGLVSDNYLLTSGTLRESQNFTRQIGKFFLLLFVWDITKCLMLISKKLLIIIMQHFIAISVV